MNRLLITQWEQGILTALWDGSRVRELNLEPEEPAVRVGDIYLGQVRNPAGNIRAAFVEVRPGILTFLPLSEGRKVRAGDVLPVQIVREAVKTKQPVVTDRISLGGRSLVLLDEPGRVAVSAKITDPVRRRELTSLLTGYAAEEGVGFILRTNAQTAADETILREAEELTASYRDLRQRAAHRPVFTRLLAGEPAYLQQIRDAREGSLSSIVTDREEIYQTLRTSPLCRSSFSPEQMVLYSDEQLPMRSLYRLDHFLAQALERRVWLKSGGTLIIEPTEAMTVIDVNTGKSTGRRNEEETFRKINREAAREIAFQMRLRNLSGIILVDFIDMKTPEYREELYHTLREALREDPVKTTLVDVTALNLAEITRKKTRKTLAEQVSALKKGQKDLDTPIAP